MEFVCVSRNETG
uniref:Uncharacterized protein MANES_12G036600 n=1 Tax=Rhizophora mucronata TaxID=61149 RepID=A0A2P2MHP3_RHIMU